MKERFFMWHVPVIIRAWRLRGRANGEGEEVHQINLTSVCHASNCFKTRRLLCSKDFTVPLSFPLEPTIHPRQLAPCVHHHPELLRRRSDHNLREILRGSEVETWSQRHSRSTFGCFYFLRNEAVTLLVLADNVFNAMERCMYRGECVTVRHVETHHRVGICGGY